MVQKKKSDEQDVLVVWDALSSPCTVSAVFSAACTVVRCLTDSGAPR